MTERAIEAAAKDSYEQGDQYYGAWDSLDPILREYAIKNAGITIRAYLTALAEDDAAVERVARAMYAARPARLIHPKMRAIEWDEAQTSVPDRIELCWADARAAIRAMGCDHD